jgi:hypothetical protein
MFSKAKLTGYSHTGSDSGTELRDMLSSWLQPNFKTSL